MANDEHLSVLMLGVDAWNSWRRTNPDVVPDLMDADLHDADLTEANLSTVLLLGARLVGANLCSANLSGSMLNGAQLRGAQLGGTDLRSTNLAWADLTGADLTGADLSEAFCERTNLTGVILTRANLEGTHLQQAILDRVNLGGLYLAEKDLRGASFRGTNFSASSLVKAKLRGADLSEANLAGVNLGGADLHAANLAGANLAGADLLQADLSKASLVDADLRDANLYESDLRSADLTRAILRTADLSGASIIEADLTNADLTGCRVYGISAWKLKTEGAKQQNLVITDRDEPEITVDNIEVAQFIYLLLHNEKIRHVIDTITSKVVLILGRFTPKRKKVLDALREELRRHDYLPILFDFDVPAHRDITETVSLLARMARFIVADLTSPRSIPKELEAIIPDLAVPVQPLIASDHPYSMFKDYWKYDWVLPVYQYKGLKPLRAAVSEKVIAPAEAMVKTLEERRRRS